jgi:hypothetical protein
MIKSLKESAHFSRLSSREIEGRNTPKGYEIATIPEKTEPQFELGIGAPRDPKTLRNFVPQGIIISLEQSYDPK